MRVRRILWRGLALASFVALLLASWMIYRSLPYVPRATWTIPEENGVDSFLGFSPDGRILVVRTRSGIQLWDVETNQRLHQVDGPITPLRFSPNCRFLIMELRGKNSAVLDAVSGKQHPGPAATKV